MQIISKKTPFSWAIGLLSVSSLFFVAGCSTKHQQVGYASGYYPSNQTRPTSGGADRYALPDPDKKSGSAAMHRATLKPYTVFGKRYHPQIWSLGHKEYGIASWYGPDFHGKKTSSGETYDMYAPATAAHKTLPMNTIVRVTHRDTGAQVKVRINDRGPFVEGRIIDLSYTAGKAIGLDRTGIAPVTLEVLEYDDHIAQMAGGDTRVASAPEVKNEVVAIKEEKVETKGAYAIQLGAFKSEDGAKRVKSETKEKTNAKSVVIRVVEFGNEKLHRVLIDGFASKEEAQKFKTEQGLNSAVIVSAS